MKQAKPSLFAFQDIITSVIGIFVFISILLVLSISVETAAILAEKVEIVEFDKSNLRDEIKDLESMNVLLTKQRDDLKEKKEICDKIVKKIEALKAEIVDIQKEIVLLSEIKVKENSKNILETLVEAGQDRVDKFVALKKSEARNYQNRLIQLENEIKPLVEKIEMYKDGAVFVNSNNTVDAKAILFVEANIRGFKVVSKKGIMSLSELELYINTLDKSANFLQFMFRPSASHFYMAVAKICKDAFVEYGATIILEKENVIDEK